jgi:hypothetical protein
MTHPIIERARETLDRLGNAEWEYGVENSQRDPYAREAQEADAFLARCAARRQSEPQQELVFKTFHNDTPSQQQSATMDAQTQAAWNEWLRVNVEDALDNYTVQVVKHVAEVIAQERREMRREMRKHVAKELRELRDEIEILRSVVKAGNVELIKRGSNVA